MALKQTLRQIELINEQKKGIKDRFYEDVDGYIYRGLANGRLFKFAKCSEVSLDGVENLGDNVCDALNSLNGRLILLQDQVDEGELNLFGTIWAANALTKNC